MAKKIEFDHRIGLRVSGREYRDFMRIAKNVHGKEPPDLLRELITAVVEGRVKITPTEEQAKVIKQNQELYYVH